MAKSHSGDLKSRRGKPKAKKKVISDSPDPAKGENDHAPAALTIENGKLPKSVKEAALRSGGFPYAEKMPQADFETELRLLQIELLKLQNWVRESGERIVLLFEGRDAAGKSSIISSFMQHLNPRHARVAALAQPTETERSQWYFQRYIAQLPSAGDMLLFDRSWYNRAGVERVMGFANGAQVQIFLREAPVFEAALVRDGLRLFKFWITIGREMQIKRLHARRHDPLKQWKLSDIDLASLNKWDDYTMAMEDMFQYTHTMDTPWIVIRGNDKRRARLNVMRAVLSSIAYADKDESIARLPDPLIAGSGHEYFYSA
jgi:polyphosphate kinase 2